MTISDDKMSKLDTTKIKELIRRFNERQCPLPIGEYRTVRDCVSHRDCVCLDSRDIIGAFDALSILIIERDAYAVSLRNTRARTIDDCAVLAGSMPLYGISHEEKLRSQRQSIDTAARIRRLSIEDWPAALSVIQDSPLE